MYKYLIFLNILDILFNILPVVSSDTNAATVVQDVADPSATSPDVNVLVASDDAAIL